MTLLFTVLSCWIEVVGRKVLEKNPPYFPTSAIVLLAMGAILVVEPFVLLSQLPVESF